MKLQKGIVQRKLRRQLHQKLEVMLEGPSKDTDLIWEARLEGMAPDIDGKVYITEFEGVNDAADLPAARHAGHHRSHRRERLRPDRPRHRNSCRRPRARPANRPVPATNDFFPILTSRCFRTDRLCTIRMETQSHLSAIARSRRFRLREYSWFMKWQCPICRKPTDSESYARFSFLQRALPADRPGQLGQREIQDQRAGDRRIRCPNDASARNRADGDTDEHED